MVKFISVLKGGQVSFTLQTTHYAKKHNTSIYDAMFIAAALKNAYELVTCDNNQAELAKKVGVKTIEC